MTKETATNGQVRSFEVAEGDVFGDLLSADRIETSRRLKVGLLSAGYFEYWRMYPALQAQVEQDSRVVETRLSAAHDVVSGGVVDTMDTADAAGRRFRQEEIDVLVLAYRTYIPDAYIHHVLSRVPDVPLLIFASQERDRFDWAGDYSSTLRNSGVMALVQSVCGLRRMGAPVLVECVAGGIHDDQAYRRIDGYLSVLTIARRLRSMTFGVIGHVFRGMFDFEYDKTKVKSALGPEILNLQIDHLMTAWENAPLDDPEVRAFLAHATGAYDASALGREELERAARVAVALRRLVTRFRLDGLALLGQHFVERKLKTTPYLGMSELHRAGFPCVSEGDVIGLIMMKVLHHLAGHMPFFVEWGEFDVERNAWMLLGHGFGDPVQSRRQPPLLTPAAEQWGLEGAGCSLAFVPQPGPCTMAHFAEHPDGWRMLVSGGEFLDLDPLPINEVHALVRVQRPIRQFVEMLVKAGVPHHAITVRGDVRPQLEQLAAVLGMRTIPI